MYNLIDTAIQNYQDQLNQTEFPQKVNIFLDDLRKTPKGFIRTYTVEETIKELKENYGNIDTLSVDNDLGENIDEGYKVLDWLEEEVFANENYILPSNIVCHSSNSSRVLYMNKLIERIYSK